MRVLLVVLCFFLLPAYWAPDQGADRTGTFYLVTKLKAGNRSFQVLYFYNDSTFSALRSGGLFAKADSVFFYPSNGFLLLRGRVRRGLRADCLSFTILERSHVKTTGEQPPFRRPAVACRRTPAGALVLAGATFRPVPGTRLPAVLRKLLLRTAHRADSTQYRFDCR
ncbi:hypothetical protein [Hymenobacter terrestris]|uniref:DUF4369 domain-containing protein n=1 Tax=Hymenobacter terrestris TaxID=2748310 RepID=A0ABX2Q717_9BACT|nr:hypothetical protein [Hymenobacter terrestris]NVO86766.1 hypothetical protein [Hymenobacter terrestris]